jgi:hypothetical protein
MNKKALILAGALCVPIAAKIGLSQSVLTPHLKHSNAMVVLEHIHGQPMVPSGIHSFGELQKYAGLYPGCDVQHAVFTTLDSDLMSYVSYAYKGKTRWTRKMRLIPKGEMVIQAGDCTILQRCGNLINMNTPVGVFDEPIDPLDVYPPIMTVVAMPMMPNAPYTPDAQTGAPMHPSMPLTNSGIPPIMGPTLPMPLVVGTPIPVVSVDEPSTLAMFLLGTVGLWLASLWRLR